MPAPPHRRGVRYVTAHWKMTAFVVATDELGWGKVHDVVTLDTNR